MPIQGKVCNPDAKTLHAKQCTKFEVSNFSHSGEILGGSKNLDESRDNNHAIFGGGF